MEHEIEKSLKKQMGKGKKVLLGILISLSSIISIYIGISIFFESHFYFGTTINSTDVSGKTVEEAVSLMENSLNQYILSLKERDGKSEQIKGEEVRLKYNSLEEFNDFKNEQQPFRWIQAVFNTNTLKTNLNISYDEELLMKKIESLDCLKTSNIVEPQNASIQYKDNSYAIVDEVLGNKINKEIFYSNIKNALLNQENLLELESIGCYENPQYTSKSKEIAEAKEQLNKYIASKITYTFGEKREILDGSIVNTWLTADDKFKVTLDETKVKGYVEWLSDTYSTVGKIRNIAASTGGRINVRGGDYGWLINKTKESEKLIAALKEGETLVKEPEYVQTAAAYGSNDIGNTYVEIDMSKQHLWFYKNGSLVVEGDVVTGNVSAGNATPKGIYKLKYKEKDAVLTGPDYASPVNFWMPFNGGIGIHDALWRNSFGEKIYMNNGSHGCVNAPYNVAKAIFNNIQLGTPVICY